MKRLTGILIAALMVVLAACQADLSHIQGPGDQGAALRSDTVFEQARPVLPQLPRAEADRPRLWDGEERQ